MRLWVIHIKPVYIKPVHIKPVYMSKKEVAFLEEWLYSANQSNLKSFQKDGLTK